MKSNPQIINQQQVELRRLLTSGKPAGQAKDLFLRQHATLHSAQISTGVAWSYEDEILDDLPEAQFRRIPPGEEHSVAWCFWHIARIEDTAMNLLVAGSPQVFSQDEWPQRLGVGVRDSGNEWSQQAVAALSQAVDFQALRAYRRAVGLRTRQIVVQLQPDQLQQNVDPARVQRVLDEGALTEASQGIAEYWGKRTIAGLLLMPGSRHLLTHLNEAARLKRKRS
jgi:hypothetical protein